MDNREGPFRADLLLLVTAMIWGFAFVAQRAGMEHLGPFWFNAVRFAMGSLVLLPFVVRRKRSHPRELEQGRERKPGRGESAFVPILLPGLLAGSVLFAGASLQQVGLVYTSAGNAGFVTGLYVIFVPILGLFRRKGTPPGIWIGALLATGGMYLLSSAGTTRMAFGDLLVLAGAIFWALHIQVISHLASPPGEGPGKGLGRGVIGVLRLAAVQFAVCFVLSLVLALATEEAVPGDFIAARFPLLYGGLVSVGIAYTLQVVAQRRAHPAHAAVIMSFEALFAGLGGWLVLDETITATGLVGCALMFLAMVFSVVSSQRSREPRGNPNASGYV